MTTKSLFGIIVHVHTVIMYPIHVRSLQMPRRSKKPLGGLAAKMAAPSLEAAKITSQWRCFDNGAEAARKVVDGALLATESATAMQRMQTEYEAAITNLIHLVLDKELDDKHSQTLKKSAKEKEARRVLSKNIRSCQ
jgi:hypothetical protein